MAKAERENATLEESRQSNTRTTLVADAPLVATSLRPVPAQRTLARATFKFARYDDALIAWSSARLAERGRDDLPMSPVKERALTVKQAASASHAALDEVFASLHTSALTLKRPPH
jgi:hypothetical protein